MLINKNSRVNDTILRNVFILDGFYDSDHYFRKNYLSDAINSETKNEFECQFSWLVLGDNRQFSTGGAVQQ